jgi:hypothetical protein
MIVWKSILSQVLRVLDINFPVPKLAQQGKARRPVALHLHHDNFLSASCNPSCAVLPCPAAHMQARLSYRTSNVKI